MNTPATAPTEPAARVQLPHAPLPAYYADEAEHARYLRRIFDANLAAGGRVLLADPFRAVSLKLLEALEGDGWRVAVSKWTVGDAADATPRPVGVFELTPPDRAP